MAIYIDNDTRMDLYCFGDNEFVSSRARAVVLVISVDDLIDNGDGTFSPRSQGLGVRELVENSPAVLCHGQRYRGQPSAFEAYGSGFLLGGNMIATARHVMDAALEHDDPPEKLRFVFGWQMMDKDTPARIPAADICSGTMHAQGEGEEIENDWALIGLTDPVQGHQPLARAANVPSLNAPLFLISHPSLLPLKYSTGWVSSVSEPGLLRAPITAFAGSSGGPVINQQTGEVVGIYVHGPDDYKVEADCVVPCNYPVNSEEHGIMVGHGRLVQIQQLP